MENKDPLILITGGSSGIGKASALSLAKAGARIILLARNLEKLKSAAMEIEAIGGTVSYYSTDLKDIHAIEETADLIIKEVGLPDVIINSAGEGEWLSLKEASIHHFKETIESPYLATAYTCKVFYDRMQDRKQGHFMIINSAASYFSFPGVTGYSAARWAMLGFAKALQADLYNSHFKVSLIAFGKVDSPYFTSNPVSEDRIPKISDWLVPTMTVEEAAAVVLKRVKSPKKTTIRPMMMNVLVKMYPFFPRMFSYLMRKTGHQA